MIVNVLYFLFLVVPGVFLIVASTVYQDWWKNIVDKTNVQFLKNNIDIISKVTGSILTALGLLLITLNLGGSFNDNTPEKKVQMVKRTPSNRPKYKNRQVRRDRKGRRYILYDRKKRYI